jgi:hypothetical protein
MIKYYAWSYLELIAYKIENDQWFWCTGRNSTVSLSGNYHADKNGNIWMKNSAISDSIVEVGPLVAVIQGFPLD